MNQLNINSSGKRLIEDDENKEKHKYLKTNPSEGELETSSTGSKDSDELIPSTFGSLKPIIHKFNFSAKLMSKGPIQKQYYAKGNIFEFEMMDYTGKIKGKVFNEDCEVLHNKLTVGKTYAFTKALLSIASLNNSTLKNYELVFDSETIIAEIEDEYLEKLENEYNIVTYRGVLDLDAGEFIDYIGRVVSIGEIETIQKRDGMNLTLRNVEVVDLHENKITIVYWNKVATDGIACLGIGKTILFQHLKINEYKREKKLFYNANSKMITDLTPSEIEKLTKDPDETTTDAQNLS